VANTKRIGGDGKRTDARWNRGLLWHAVVRRRFLEVKFRNGASQTAAFADSLDQWKKIVTCLPMLAPLLFVSGEHR